MGVTSKWPGSILFQRDVNGVYHEESRAIKLSSKADFWRPWSQFRCAAIVLSFKHHMQASVPRGDRRVGSGMVPLRITYSKSCQSSSEWLVPLCRLSGQHVSDLGFRKAKVKQHHAS
jgi:hypothetical protein